MAVYALAALAIVVVVNLIANRFVKQVDLTANKRYSLSQQTDKILKDLNRDVELLYFDRKSSFNNVRDNLEQYAIASHHVKLTYVDPDREPGKAQKYNVKTYGTLIVAMGDKTETAKSTKEEDITGTIIRLMKGGPKTVYFLQGHGERDIASDERLGYSAREEAAGREQLQGGAPVADGAGAQDAGRRHDAGGCRAGQRPARPRVGSDPGLYQRRRASVVPGESLHAAQGGRAARRVRSGRPQHAGGGYQRHRTPLRHR